MQRLRSALFGKSKGKKADAHTTSNSASATSETEGETQADTMATGAEQNEATKVDVEAGNAETYGSVEGEASTAAAGKGMFTGLKGSPMFKIVAIAGVVVAVALLGAIGYMATRPQSNANPVQTDSEQSGEENRVEVRTTGDLANGPQVVKTLSVRLGVDIQHTGTVKNSETDEIIVGIEGKTKEDADTVKKALENGEIQKLLQRNEEAADQPAAPADAAATDGLDVAPTGADATEAAKEGEGEGEGEGEEEGGEEEDEAAPVKPAPPRKTNTIAGSVLGFFGLGGDKEKQEKQEVGSSGEASPSADGEKKKRFSLSRKSTKSKLTEAEKQDEQPAGVTVSNKPVDEGVQDAADSQDADFGLGKHRLSEGTDDSHSQAQEQAQGAADAATTVAAHAEADADAATTAAAHAEADQLIQQKLAEAGILDEASALIDAGQMLPPPDA